MYYMIAYDLKDDKRRTKIHNVLKNYGQWTQYSVFECDITEQAFQQLFQAVTPLIQVENGDSIRYYPLCGACEQKIEHLGSQPAHKKGTFV